jgi:hypothetical protein
MKWSCKLNIYQIIYLGWKQRGLIMYLISEIIISLGEISTVTLKFNRDLLEMMIKKFKCLLKLKI